MRIHDKKMKFLLFTAVLIVGSCQVPQQSGPTQIMPKDNSSEDLLAAQGTWNMVEEKQPASPVNQHLKARSQVDFHDTSAKRSYTKTASEDELEEEVHFRVMKLENEVADLRRDFKKILPPLSNLLTSDVALSKAISEIQSDEKVEQKKDHGVVAKYAVPKDKIPKAESPKKMVKKEKPKAVHKPVVSDGPNVVVSLRRGEHPGKTRLVLDMKQKAKVKYDLDNDEKLLLIELPGVGWDTKTQEAFKNHPLIKSFSAQGSSKDGTTVAIELHKSAKVLLSTVLGPNSTNPNYRYVIDLAAL